MVGFKFLHFANPEFKILFREERNSSQGKLSSYPNCRGRAKDHVRSSEKENSICSPDTSSSQDHFHSRTNSPSNKRHRSKDLNSGLVHRSALSHLSSNNESLDGLEVIQTTCSDRLDLRKGRRSDEPNERKKRISDGSEERIKPKSNRVDKRRKQRYDRSEVRKKQRSSRPDKMVKSQRSDKSEERIKQRYDKSEERIKQRSDKSEERIKQRSDKSKERMKQRSDRSEEKKKESSFEGKGTINERSEGSKSKTIYYDSSNDGRSPESASNDWPHENERQKMRKTLDLKVSLIKRKETSTGLKSEQSYHEDVQRSRATQNRKLSSDRVILAVNLESDNKKKNKNHGLALPGDETLGERGEVEMNEVEVKVDISLQTISRSNKSR